MRIVLMMAIHALAMTVIMGIGIIAEMVAGIVEGRAILIAVLAGFFLGMPVAWVVARKLTGDGPGQG